MGTLESLWRFPVKSMAGEPLTEAQLGWNGLEGDRQYGFYRADDASRFPWLSGRDLPELVRFTPAYRDGSDPRHSALDVSTPEGTRHDIHDPALLDLLSRRAGKRLAMMQLGRGAFDSMPVSLLTTATLSEAAQCWGSEIDSRRFRANLVVRTELAPRAELSWLGAPLIFGEGEMAVQLMACRPIPRCSFITVDPQSGARDPSLLRAVSQHFDGNIGLYCTAASVGALKPGMAVYRPL